MSNTKLFKLFGGKSVNIVMKSVKGAQVLGEGMVAEGSVILNGYLVDEDDEFYYLSATNDEIDDALRKEDLVRMYLEEEVIEVEFEDTGDERH